MMHRRWLVLVAFVCATMVFGAAQTRGPAATEPAPDVAGDWTGVWSVYNPAQPAVPPKEQCKRLDAKIVAKDGIWQATFEGDCGRPYKYSITMEGRQVGKVVLFKGTTDLGARDGGVYDWVGRATDKEFIGFYTSAFSTGVFNLSRAK